MNFVPGVLPRKPTDRRFPKAFSAPEDSVIVVPKYWDVKPQMLDSDNQGNQPICAAEGGSGWLQANRWKYDDIIQHIDPLPIYNEARRILGNPPEQGATMESVLQAMTNLGLMLPLDTEHTRSIYSLPEVELAMFKYGPLLATLNVTEQWQFAKHDGWIEPGGAVLGPHCVVLCEYALEVEVPYVAAHNSWGLGNGCRGNVRLPLAVFEEEFVEGLVMIYRPSIAQKP